MLGHRKNNRFYLGAQPPQKWEPRFAPAVRPSIHPSIYQPPVYQNGYYKTEYGTGIIKVCLPESRYLKGADAELDAETQVNVKVIRQEVEHHVVGPEQRDEEEGGFSEAPEGRRRKKE